MHSSIWAIFDQHESRDQKLTLKYKVQSCLPASYLDGFLLLLHGRPLWEDYKKLMEDIWRLIFLSVECQAFAIW